MFSRIKEWIKNHSGLLPIIIVLACIIICAVITVLAYYKVPVTLSNSEDSVKMVTMIKEHVPNLRGIENIKLQSGVVYRNLNDSIFLLSEKIKDEDDIAWYTRVLSYDAITDSDTVNYITIFEIDENFLKEDVGKHLITFKKN